MTDQIILGTGRVFSGMQPTNIVHVGNYFGALKNWVSLSREMECFFCVVDLHALTAGMMPPEQLRYNVDLVAACYLAAGVDLSRSVIFVQSAVRQHTELHWLLSSITPLGWLNRMTQFKDKAGKHKDQASLGLYSYPVLQAADILLYKSTHVPVGEDQKQHLELSRDIAAAFNRSVNAEPFVLPEPVIQGAAPRVMSLRDGTVKMSKSDPSEYSRLSLLDTDEDIVQKIRKAKTDSEPLPATVEGLESRPEAQNLMILLSAFREQPFEKILSECAGQRFSFLKEALCEEAVSTITPIRQKVHELMKDRGSLHKVLSQGAQRAAEVAEGTMKEIRERVGLFI